MFGLDLGQITLLKTLASLVGLIVVALLWRGLCTFADEVIKRAMLKRRVGSRNTDDVKASYRSLEWYDRLIEAMSSNSEVNLEIAKSLQQMTSKQDVILESFRVSQMQQRESLDQGKAILAILRGRPQEG